MTCSESPREGSDHAARSAGALDRALALVRFLRANCEWDAAQTAHTLIPSLLEESREVADAIRTGGAADLEGELGDLLLNLAFQVVLGEESGAFDADSVTRALERKMARRHPHLYGLGRRRSWDEVKARERREALDAVPPGVDPLTRAHRIQARAAGVGFDWDDHRGACDKVAEELDEVREAVDGGTAAEVEEEIGDLLFAVVNVARRVGTHPVAALDRANHKFRRRFTALERLARERGVIVGDASLAELDVLWDAVKDTERSD